MTLSGAGGEEKLELHFRRRSGALADPWRIKPRAQSEKHKKEMDLRGKVVGQIGENCLVVPLKKFPVRVAKYDVRLRDVSLRAAHAMHTILTRMVVFQCHANISPLYL